MFPQRGKSFTPKQPPRSIPVGRFAPLRLGCQVEIIDGRAKGLLRHRHLLVTL